MDQKTHKPAQSDPEATETAEPLTCARCGTRAPGGTPPPTWTCSVENGSRRYFCDDCARANLRAIEGRLDSSWW
ncbi:hypothetical protein BLA24_25090 [Streptomyces cinnamoneus]|uniref:Uncharacterized protein n=1 Tax=Streptomyces cinnamoneus TaxID=53446 RepID=A0A2G1XDM2_STRCJ|nr:hypothetical protein [Streptomyces cinnamoneus]PHQ49330.1 hypothetical protein BLA24_25090 [Streptomyces cinnamoneus]PPT15022.1 hypothetical protein CYQ11_20980 [Streptomyces cinnamoneus]